MFEAARGARSTGWLIGAGGLLGAGLAALACSGLFFDLFLAEHWDEWFPAPDPFADLVVADASGIDWLAVHRELLPSWVLSITEGDDEAKRDALLAAIAVEPGLTAAVAQMDTSIRAGDFPEIQAAFALWNRRLDADSAPFFVDVAGSRGIYVKTYRTLWDGTAQVGPHPSRVRLLTRVDRLNVVEGYLGQVSDPAEGALIVVDRVAEHTADDLWPLLDPDSLDPAAGPIQAEVRAALAPPHFAALASTAAARARLLASVVSIRGRSDCSDYIVRSVPALGFGDHDLEGMSEVAWAERGKGCPSVTPGEASAIEEATAALQDEDALPEALSALLAFALRPTAVHEARHVADAIAFGAVDAVACPGCPDGFASRAELSAYLASFAADGVAGAAWVQACGATKRGWGSHVAAFQAIATMLTDERCDAEIPADLSHRARELEIDWLMREEAVTLPPEFPAAVRWPE